MLLSYADCSLALAAAHSWINYYHRHTKRAFRQLMRQLNYRLMKWAVNKYKPGGIKKGFAFLKRIRKEQPNLFAHWKAGFN